MVGLGVLVIYVTAFTIAYYTLRNRLVSDGAPRDELDAISKGIARSSGATAAIGGSIAVVTLLSISIFTNAIGVYQTFANETNLIMQFVIAITIVSISIYIGWRFKGRDVYEKYVPKPVGGESR